MFGTLFQDIASFGGTIGQRQLANQQREMADRQFRQGQQLQDQYLQQLNPLLSGANQRMEQYGQEASADRAGARDRFNALGDMGLSDRTNALRSFYDLLPIYTGAAGINTGGSGLYYQPTSFDAGAGGAPATQPNRTTPGTGGGGNAAAVLNSRNRPAAGTTTVDPRVNVGPLAPGSTGQNGQTGQSGQAGAVNPYALTADQQAQLNGQVDSINRQKMAAMSELDARFAQRGITDPRAMEIARQQLSERYDTMAEQSKAQFGETARANREQAVGNLLNLFNNMQQQGTQNVGQSGQALLGVSNAAQGASDNQMQVVMNALSQLGNLSGNLMGAGNGNFNNSIQTGMQANQMGGQALSDLLSLAAFFGGGGFNRPQRPAAPTS